jgi:hypothetical protein
MCKSCKRRDDGCHELQSLRLESIQDSDAMLRSGEHDTLLVPTDLPQSQGTWAKLRFSFG